MTGYFTHDEPDIVRLHSNNDFKPRRGWVNVGAFAVLIETDDRGNLRVETYPCGNEDKPLSNCAASHTAAMAQGATDCDADE